MKKISSLITTEEINKWEESSIIAITAGTGTGKSYFIKNGLYTYAKKNNQRILILVNRNRLKSQYIKEIVSCNKTDIIDINTYQKLEQIALHNQIDNLKHYQYIVCDEFHYFFTDAKFNHLTDLSLDLILKQNAIRIFMSATSNIVLDYIKSKDISFNEYTILNDYSYIHALKFYDEDDTVLDLMTSIIKNNTNEKIIYFCNNIEKAYNAYEKLIGYSVFNCSQSNTSYKKYISAAEMEELIETEKFNNRILVTTIALDNGVNIVDKDLKHIIIDVEDVDTLIQCLGRKRIIDNTDSINVYIKNFNKCSIGGRLTQARKNIEMADCLLNFDTQTLLLNYPREIDYSRVIYDITDPTNNETVIKKVNDIMYFKYSKDIEFFEFLLQQKDKDAWKKHISKMLNGKEYVSMEDTIYINDLELYLESVIGKKLYKEEQQEFINVIGLKDSRNRIQKSISLLNEYLKENSMPYIILSKTTRDSERNSLRFWIVEKLIID